MAAIIPGESNMRRSLLHAACLPLLVGAATVAGCSGGSNANAGHEPVDAGAAGTGGGAGEVADCAPLDPIPPRLWRLSMAQFSNSVRDLLGLATGPAVNHTGGASEYAFFSDTSGTVDDTLAFSLYQAVQSALEQVRSRLGELAACADGQSEDACAENFARSFGKRALRRPLEASEVDTLLQVYTEGRKQDFDTGIETMIEALLQSPSFLYRSELGTAGAAAGETMLTAHETATQLAYFFFDSTPDPELIAAADSGQLATPEGILGQVERLLATDAVRQNISRIVLDWFGVRQVLSKTTKSAVLLATLSEAERDQARLALDLLASTQRFIDDVLWQNPRPVNELIRSQRVFVNRRLATLYGLPFSGLPEDFLALDFPAEQQRAGMLTQPAVLWAVSDPEATSIVHRGLYVRNDLLCQDPVPSPGDLLEQPDIKAALATLTTEREKSDYRMNDPTCKNCHSHIDPFALVLESFDPVGAYRTLADGVPVDPTGDFTLSPSLTGPISSAAAFAHGLATDGLFTACAAQKIASYAIGRAIREQSTCEIEQVHAAYGATTGTIESLFREVARASFLTTRTGGTP
jgi:hypothetical protein